MLGNLLHLSGKVRFCGFVKASKVQVGSAVMIGLGAEAAVRRLKTERSEELQEKD